MSDGDKVKLEYLFKGLAMDSQTPAVMLPPGTCSRLYGVDGRYTNSLRKFPGMVEVDDVTPGATNNFNITQFRCLPFQYDSDTISAAFFLQIQDGDSPTTANRLYYQTQNRRWSLSSYTVTDKDDSAYAYDDIMDITSNGSFLYIFSETDEPIVLYNVAGTITKEEMGPQFLTAELNTPASTTEKPTGGYLNHRGVYRIAVRLYDPTRKVHTDLSPVLTQTMDDYTTGENRSLEFSWSRPASATNYTTLEVYRTINLNGPLDVYQGGVFFKEKTYTTITSPQTVTVGTLPDTALVLQDVFDPWADSVEDPPQSGVCHFFQGSLFSGQDPDTDNGVGLRWTNPFKTSTEEFGDEYSYAGSSDDGKVMVFADTGEDLFAATSRMIYHITKDNGVVSINRTWKDMAPVNAHCFLAAKRALFMVTSQGVMRIDASSGAVGAYSALHGVLFDDWGGALDDLWMAYDARMGCIFVLNTDKKEMICIWELSNRVSLLKNCPYRGCCTGPGYEKDAQNQAFFIDRTGRIVTPDYQNTGEGTMLGLSSTAGLTTTSDGSGSNELIVSGAEFSEIHYNIYILNGTDAGKWAWVTAASGDNLTVTGIGDQPAGTQFTRDPVFMAARMWPFTPDERPAFGRKILSGVTVHTAKATDFTSRVDNFMRVGAYRNSGSSLQGAKSITIDNNNNPANQATNLSVDGIVLEPYIEQVSGDTDIEFVGLQLEGTVVDTEEVT